MTTELNKRTIGTIKTNHERAGWSCKTEFPIIRNNENIMDSGVAKVDLCCEKKFPVKQLKCWEVEDSQSQAVKNFRDLEQIKREFSKLGFMVSTCQLIAGENPSGVCK